MDNPNLSVSFCIVCANRLGHLQKTILRNIEDNSDFEDLQFVVLDYNSNDGIEEWVKSTLGDYLNTGRVRFYRTESRPEYEQSHSRNVCFRLATGDILCNINADYFTGRGFARYVARYFTERKNIFLTTIDYHDTLTNYLPNSDNYGRLCVRKEDFIAVRGYDETMINYGFEDFDLTNRLELNGLKRELLIDKNYLHFISHEHRISKSKTSGHIERLYSCHVSAAESTILILYRDCKCEIGAIIDNWVLKSQFFVNSIARNKFDFEFGIREDTWQSGIWTEDTTTLMLKVNGISFQYIKEIDDNGLSGLTDAATTRRFVEITDREKIEELAIFLHIVKSRNIMERNLKDGKILVNTKGFGETSDIEILS